MDPNTMVLAVMVLVTKAPPLEGINILPTGVGSFSRDQVVTK